MRGESECDTGSAIRPTRRVVAAITAPARPTVSPAAAPSASVAAPVPSGGLSRWNCRNSS